jgi:hypothetical protein
MGARAFLRTFTVLCLAGFSLALFSSAASASECANEARRKEQNATYLPDCRAYEMVSPADKKGSDVVGANNTAHLSDTGERATFETFAGIGDVHGSGGFGFFQYVTKRDTNGWGVPVGVDPQPSQTDLQVVQGSTSVPLFSSSLDTGLVISYQMAGSITPDIPEGFNLYLENTETAVLQAITSPSGVEPSTISSFAFNEAARGASPDLGVVAFQGAGKLLPGLPSGLKLYVWNHGTVEVGGVLPDGTLPEGGSGGARPEAGVAPHSVSADGSRVLFRSPTNGSKPTQLYLRRNSTSTAWVSQAETSVPNPEPNGIEYLDMSADGSKVLLSSSDKLTDSDPGGEGYGLYLYTDGANPEAEQNLTFIARTLAFGGGAGAAEKTFSGMSGDGSHVYFFSQASATLPQQGTYLWDEGALRFVAPTVVHLFPRAEETKFVPGQDEMSTDGSHLAFLLPYQLTEAPLGANPEGGAGPNLTAMYLYDEASETLRCVSCLPTGGPTTSRVSVWPAADEALPNNRLATYGRFISSDGRYVFFSTADALVPGDVNGIEDVYGYDAQTGTASLLSSGTSGDGSWFSDASADGSNVAFDSRASYLRQDADKLIDVYDVRVDGGFPQPPPSTGGCVGDECQGLPSAVPAFNTASGFTGLGNIVSSASGKSQPKGLTRAQKLKRALRACKRRHGKARQRCEASARKRYGARKASKSTSHAAARR